MKPFRINPFILFLILVLPLSSLAQVVVLQSDFGVKDAAVSAMKLVISGVDQSIKIVDNTHEIKPFQIYEGAYRLYQSAPLAPPGTVYVSVVDPGVGSERLSIVAKDSRGVYYVTPDNGTLSFIEKEIGIVEVRVIDESKLRRPGSENSHTFHGRDIYAYVAALLASQSLKFEDVGLSLDLAQLKRFDIPKAQISDEKSNLSSRWFFGRSNQRSVLSGYIEIHDIQYGNIWTNIPENLLKKFGVAEGDIVKVKIFKDGKIYKKFQIPFFRSFAKAKEGSTLSYFNSLGKLACSKRVGNLARSENIGFGPSWTIQISK